MGIGLIASLWVPAFFSLLRVGHFSGQIFTAITSNGPHAQLGTRTLVFLFWALGKRVFDTFYFINATSTVDKFSYREVYVLSSSFHPIISTNYH